MPEEWKTAPLWGVAYSAPYFHDGGAADSGCGDPGHEGDAQTVTEAYRKLSASDLAARSCSWTASRLPPTPRPRRRGLSLGQLALAAPSERGLATDRRLADDPGQRGTTDHPPSARIIGTPPETVP